MRITFFGATETVTGSRFLVEHEGARILIDCGMFQGLKADREKNWETFPIEPSSISAVILTHAHLDHSGYLPALVAQGFKGPIHMTSYTRKLVEIVLRDSAHIQDFDAQTHSRTGEVKKHPKPALYTDVDVDSALELIREHSYRTLIDIAPEITATLYPSGHILGSSFVVITAGDERAIFTSDLGRGSHPLLNPPDLPPELTFNAVITESTYGNRVHNDIDTFAQEINDGLARGGSILIPAFAIDRTEVILMALRHLVATQQIPSLPIFVDSPMAVAVLTQYQDAVKSAYSELRPGAETTWANQNPFDPGHLVSVVTTEHSKSLSEVKEQSIIISASGMASGGRVVHHLERMLPDAQNTILLVGYQAIGSRGRLLQDGADQISIHGRIIDVRAHISTLEIFSVHADSNELIQWLSLIKKPRHCFVVHGETNASALLSIRLNSELGWSSLVPVAGKPYEI